MEQHFRTYDPRIERATEFQCYLTFCVAAYQESYKQLEKQKTKKTAFNNRLCSNNNKNKNRGRINNERNSSFESEPTVVLDVSDTSTNDSIFDPVHNKRACYQVVMNCC
ncbi:hypothetical protein TNCV_3012571 [Trichonephila clavipes]|nr:hypothetical protein TNCV_3012571 [Trichonephila clavipes]